MPQSTYIGVTGFMTPQEVRAALRCFSGSPACKFMVGVLVSSKTLAGKRNKWPGRYPATERIVEIFQPHAAAVNLIHYNTDEPNTLSGQLLRLMDLAGSHLHGFQLNIAWPSIGEIETFHEATGFKQRIVLRSVGERWKKLKTHPRSSPTWSTTMVASWKTYSSIRAGARDGPSISRRRASSFVNLRAEIST